MERVLLLQPVRSELALLRFPEIKLTVPRTRYSIRMQGATTTYYPGCQHTTPTSPDAMAKILAR